MNEGLINLILTQLFEAYQKEPQRQFTISHAIRENGLDINETRDFLSNQGWIRDVLTISGDVFCRITIQGIEHINRTWLMSRLFDIIEGLGTRGGRGDLMEILEVPATHHAMMLDLVRHLEDLNFARLEHSVVDNNLIAELTEEGRNIFENRPKFFS